jgi:hypothetical protein
MHREVLLDASAFAKIQGGITTPGSSCENLVAAQRRKRLLQFAALSSRGFSRMTCRWPRNREFSSKNDDICNRCP